MRRHRNERLEAYFRDHADLGVAAVWLFGTWTAEPPPGGSRLGLGVLTDPRHRPDRRSRTALGRRLEHELTEVAGEPFMDLVMLDDAPPRTGRRIVTEGRLLLLRDPDTERCYLREVQLRAADLEAFFRRARRVRTPAVSRPARPAGLARVRP